MNQQEEVIVNKIRQYLKSKNVKFTEDLENGFDFTIHLGSETGSAWIEEIDENGEICYQVNTMDDNGTIDYLLQIEETSDYDSLEQNIYELIEFLKLKGRIVTKIEAKINQIEELCEELGVPLDTFIEVTYNF